MALDALRAIEREAVMPTYARQPVEFVRGEGTRLWDADGNEYLDFLAGISVVQVGHCHPALVEAVREQAGRLWHVGNLFYTEPAMRLAERLSEASLGGKVFFTNSGAEAVECALKLARRHRAGGEIVVVESAFHGRTYGALSATPQESKQAPFAPLVPGFRVVPRGDADALRSAVGPSTAAVLLEPIQGESGIHPLSDEVLLAAREACDEHGALLVFDEIQCGLGRTGTLWAHEHTGARPDVMTLAKGLGGGLPIGACLTTPEFADTLGPGDHGSTFAGGPIQAAAANAVLDVILADGFLDSVAAKGERLRAGLEALPVERVRGRGLMLGFDVEDAPAVARRLLLDERLVVNATGPGTIRLLPPLTVSAEDIEDALRRIASALGGRPVFEDLIRAKHDAWNMRDAEAGVRLISPDFEWIPALGAGAELDGAVYVGHDGWRAYMAALDEIWADRESRILHFEVRGDRAAGRCVMELTGRASGLHVEREYGIYYEFRDGRLARGRTFLDVEDAFRALDG